ncbi:hypothetical protein [Bosea sp. UC22_33]|uniref:hypothetical protein n=1 Tax=Bosea sp. UC22_33 TaxID=3350165 RepID=UPI00366A5791
MKKSALKPTRKMNVTYRVNIKPRSHMLAGRQSSQTPQIAFNPERKIALIPPFSVWDRVFAAATRCAAHRRVPRVPATIRMGGIAGMLRPFADWTPAPGHALLARQQKHGVECRGTNG